MGTTLPTTRPALTPSFPSASVSEEEGWGTNGEGTHNYPQGSKFHVWRHRGAQHLVPGPGGTRQTTSHSGLPLPSQMRTRYAVRAPSSYGRGSPAEAFRPFRRHGRLSSPAWKVVNRGSPRGCLAPMPCRIVGEGREGQGRRTGNLPLPSPFPRALPSPPLPFPHCFPAPDFKPTTLRQHRRHSRHGHGQQGARGEAREDDQGHAQGELQQTVLHLRSARAAVCVYVLIKTSTPETRERNDGLRNIYSPVMTQTHTHTRAQARILERSYAQLAPAFTASFSSRSNPFPWLRFLPRRWLRCSVRETAKRLRRGLQAGSHTTSHCRTAKSASEQKPSSRKCLFERGGLDSQLRR